MQTRINNSNSRPFFRRNKTGPKAPARSTLNTISVILIVFRISHVSLFRTLPHTDKTL
nr:hypothetical protein [Citrobacter freundii]